MSPASLLDGLVFSSNDFDSGQNGRGVDAACTDVYHY
jgi:hypothetical protein